MPFFCDSFYAHCFIFQWQRCRRYHLTCICYRCRPDSKEINKSGLMMSASQLETGSFFSFQMYPIALLAFIHQSMYAFIRTCIEMLIKHSSLKRELCTKKVNSAGAGGNSQIQWSPKKQQWMDPQSGHSMSSQWYLWPKMKWYIHIQTGQLFYLIYFTYCGLTDNYSKGRQRDQPSVWRLLEYDSRNSLIPWIWRLKMGA